ncbi:SusD family protein [Sphingobacterium nematocida]|uniref:SusD family protein n=1 Tax=Sphingobacterium nematocida TaxID=1513896 RepID=A0A1T5D7K8_9SPHI|nr:RagB/SusD family nutrient uptake outer membrane protein [Sphingobacterium nematocida]SKB67577.1 SusD family protein [Sphingobacterium nematocida]
MKNIFKSFLFAALTVSLGLSSCKGMLDITPVNSMKPETISDYESILLGGYPRVDYFLRTELMTDNAMVNLNTTLKLSTAEEPWFVFSSSHMLGEPIDPYWGQLYKTIFYANTVLDKFAGMTPDASEKKKYEQVKGEAYALRAYAYFYLVNMYADVYSPENLELPGVPMPLDAEDVNEFSKDNTREPIGKVWAQIVSDLKQAETLLQGKPGNDRFRFNATTVQLLSARVALFMGKYDEAIAYASEVMASARLSNMSSMQARIDEKGDKAAFSGNFGFIDTDYNSEVLFFTGGRANNNLFYYYQAAAKPTEELLELTKRNGDLVDYRQYIFDSFEDFSIQGAALVGKTVYNMFATQDRYWFYIGLKASEAHVIRAEAYARKQEYVKALDDINKLLVTRYKKGSFVALQESDYINKEDILKRVLDERRLETAFDGGLRFFDLRRLGKPEIKHVYKNSQEFVLKKNDPKYVLQIPMSEQNNSPGMPTNPR